MVDLNASFPNEQLIFVSFQMGNLLIELTQLSSDHVAQQTDVVARFSNRIPAIFEQNAQTYESNVYQFNVKLEEVKLKLTQDIASFLPQLSVMDNMDNCDRLAENFVLLKQYCRILTAFETSESWITKEETLLGVAGTTYPEIAVIHDHLVPFTELIKCDRLLFSYKILISHIILSIIAVIVWYGVDTAACGQTAHGSISIATQ